MLLSKLMAAEDRIKEMETDLKDKSVKLGSLQEALLKVRSPVSRAPASGSGGWG